MPSRPTSWRGPSAARPAVHVLVPPTGISLDGQNDVRRSSPAVRPQHVPRSPLVQRSGTSPRVPPGAPRRLCPRARRRYSPLQGASPDKPLACVLLPVASPRPSRAPSGMLPGYSTESPDLVPIPLCRAGVHRERSPRSIRALLRALLGLRRPHMFRTSFRPFTWTTIPPGTTFQICTPNRGSRVPTPLPLITTPSGTALEPSRSFSRRLPSPASPPPPPGGLLPGPSAYSGRSSSRTSSASAGRRTPGGGLGEDLDPRPGPLGSLASLGLPGRPAS